MLFVVFVLPSRILFAVYLDLFFLISAVGLPSRTSAAMCIEQYIIYVYSVFRLSVLPMTRISGIFHVAGTHGSV